VFSRTHSVDNPEFVLDHPSCLMCVQYHPVIPSIVAAASYNGEVIIWDLTAPEQPLAVSAISEYSHKLPVMSISWVFTDFNSESRGSTGLVIICCME
jgi:WD40 repeat protein